LGKQTIDAAQVDYAAKKIASVRALHRTSLPIPSAGGMQPAKKPCHIIGGLLTFESDWKPRRLAQGRSRCDRSRGAVVLESDESFVIQGWWPDS
jgi:hypothetical protein